MFSQRQKGKTRSHSTRIRKVFLAKESGVGFFVNLLVGKKQTHGVDDESTAMLAKYQRGDS